MDDTLCPATDLSLQDVSNAAASLLAVLGEPICLPRIDDDAAFEPLLHDHSATLQV